MRQFKGELCDKKLVVLVRAPEDVMVSLYFHKVKREQAFDGSLYEFLELETGGLGTLITYYNLREKNRDVSRTSCACDTSGCTGTPAEC